VGFVRICLALPCDSPMPTLAAQDITLAQLKESFGLQHLDDPKFFPEWQPPDIELSPLEQQTIDRIKANFTSLMDTSPVLENIVKMVILAPILDLLGFYQLPFAIQTEPSIEITTEDEGVIIRGRIDILVLKNQLWLMVIESKRSDFSVTRAIPQTLSYLLANPIGDRPTFGLITNGNEFLFLKATRQPIAQYANSRLFSLINPSNDLYDVLVVLKHLSQKLQT
jgi:predicted type IV restriction endonuclease